MGVPVVEGYERWSFILVSSTCLTIDDPARDTLYTNGQYYNIILSPIACFTVSMKYDRMSLLTGISLSTYEGPSCD